MVKWRLVGGCLAVAFGVFGCSADRAQSVVASTNSLGVSRIEIDKTDSLVTVLGFAETGEQVAKATSRVGAIDYVVDVGVAPETLQGRELVIDVQNVGTTTHQSPSLTPETVKLHGYPPRVVEFLTMPEVSSALEKHGVTFDLAGPGTETPYIQLGSACNLAGIQPSFIADSCCQFSSSPTYMWLDGFVSGTIQWIHLIRISGTPCQGGVGPCGWTVSSSTNTDRGVARTYVVGPTGTGGYEGACGNSYSDYNYGGGEYDNWWNYFPYPNPQGNHVIPFSNGAGGENPNPSYEYGACGYTCCQSNGQPGCGTTGSCHAC